VTGVNVGPTSNQAIGVYQLSVTNGSATALYHVDTPAAGIEAFAVPLYAIATSGATVGVTSAPTVMASFVGAGSGYDQFSSTQNEPVVSASASAAALSNLAWPTVTIGTTNATTGGGQLTSCATTLLFPYIVNSGGYDTGIALTNASAGTSVSQAGACSVQFFGTGAPTTNPYMTDSIAAGAIAAFTLSSQAPGFQGYAIATCGFQEAHGFAFITDGYGSVGRGLSQGYLAIVTSAAGTSVTAPF
jgi:hypothetical protein